MTSPEHAVVATTSTNGTARPSVSVRAGTEADLPAIARLYSPPYEPAVLRWLLDADQGGAPHSFVAADGDRIIGHNGYTVSRFQTPQGELTGVHCVNWIVDGTYRGLGLGNKVFRAAFPVGDFVYEYGGTERSRALFVEMGFVQPFNLQQLVKVTRPFAWARTLDGPLPRRLLKAAVLGARARMTRPARIAGPRIAIRPYDARLRPVAQRPWPAVANAEAPVQIDWYLRCPVVSARAFHITRGDAILGLALCLVKEHAAGVKTARIVHLSYLGQDESVWSSALDALERRLVESGCAMISTFASHPRFLAALGRRGFVARGQVPFWLLDLEGRLPREGWHLTGLEGDIGYRRV